MPADAWPDKGEFLRARYRLCANNTRRNSAIQPKHPQQTRRMKQRLCATPI